MYSFLFFTIRRKESTIMGFTILPIQRTSQQPLSCQNGNGTCQRRPPPEEPPIQEVATETAAITSPPPNHHIAAMTTEGSRPIVIVQNIFSQSSPSSSHQHHHHQERPNYCYPSACYLSPYAFEYCSLPPSFCYVRRNRYYN